MISHFNVRHERVSVTYSVEILTESNNGKCIQAAFSKLIRFRKAARCLYEAFIQTERGKEMTARFPNTPVYINF